jgi:hypothetical protein
MIGGSLILVPGRLEFRLGLGFMDHRLVLARRFEFTGPFGLAVRDPVNSFFDRIGPLADLRYVRTDLVTLQQGQLPAGYLPRLRTLGLCFWLGFWPLSTVPGYLLIGHGQARTDASMRACRSAWTRAVSSAFSRAHSAGPIFAVSRGSEGLGHLGVGDRDPVG